jgi:NAD(P)-dependent dehydrogenase (short-subunit alcohol dehydrogenase family)
LIFREPAGSLIAQMQEDLFALDGRRALVTGGARGVGRFCAEALLAAGASVTITSRDADAAAAAAAEMASLGPCDHIAANLAQPEGVVAVGEALRERVDALDILVNNAGVTWGAPLETHPPEAWAKVLRLDVAVPFQMAQTLLGLLEAASHPGAPARIVNIGSIDGHAVGAYQNFSYAAAKAALHQLTRVLAVELGPRGIAVNCLAPGPVPTDMTATLLAERGAGILGSAPLGCLASRDDVAGALIYLTSRASAAVTGVVLPVDGGLAISTWGDRST